MHDYSVAKSGMPHGAQSARRSLIAQERGSEWIGDLRWVFRLIGNVQIVEVHDALMNRIFLACIQHGPSIPLETESYKLGSVPIFNQKKRSGAARIN